MKRKKASTQLRHSGGSRNPGKRGVAGPRLKDCRGDVSSSKKSGLINMSERFFPIVGIGASAGGLEAVTQLLSCLPSDTGMAFVIVQHMDPTRDSLLAMILQKATEMPVTQAKNDCVIKPNNVYVIPPNTHMIVNGSKLQLMPRPEGVHAMSVNCFLNSLAEERGNKAIAVILSGTASDGALGVQAIKSEGGIVFAQDEQSAGYFGMPQSAVATGVVDFILPPEKIAAELVAIAMHPVLGPDASVFFEDEKSLNQIFALLRRTTEVDFSLYKPSTIKRRLLRRLMLHKIHKLENFKNLLEKNPDEVRALHDDLLIHVTHFFREPKCIALLRSKVFPRVLKSLPVNAPIRVWVPGCSSGEEAYSLAIVLFDFLSERDSMNPIQIFATDISEISLERARAGVYSDEIQNHVSPRLLRRFFTKTDRGYSIVKRVRDACVFARQDLVKDPPFANVDIISCSNVLIYLGQLIQKQILPMFHYALRPSGALILGSAETVGESENLFVPIDKKCRLYYKKPSASRVLLPSRIYPILPRPEESLLRKKVSAEISWPETDVQRTAERILLSRFAPASVIVSGDLTILHFRGHVSRYLEPITGKANLSLLQMLPAHVGKTLRSLIEKAKKEVSPARVSGIEIGDYEGGQTKKITIEAIPFTIPISGERYFIVLFEDDLPELKKSKALQILLLKQTAQSIRPESASIRRLKNELSSTRGYLQTIVEEHEAANEELKSANEEIISSNEELQSTNEEMEIAKEELQAANEELNTVNEELQTRNTDLGLLNDDLSNLIASVHLAIVMVSSDLRIRKFSAMAEKIMNLIPSDIGRPIGDIKPQITLPNIEEFIHEVIETVTTKELEVRDREQHSYSVRIQPYKTMENKIEGAVIVFIDNDPIKRSLHGVKDVSAFEAVLEIGSESLAILDTNLCVKTVSRAMYQSFGLAKNSLGSSLFKIDGGRWNTPKLRSHLEILANQGVAFSRLLVAIGDSSFYFSARQVTSAGNGPPFILLSINKEI